MAEAIQITGPAKIFVASPTAGTVELLGYSANGCDIEEERFWHDVPGDQKGGDVGPPIDIQHMGAIHRIRFELTNFDLAVWNKVRARVAGATAGTIDNVGSLMIGNTKIYRLHIDGQNANDTFGPINYPTTIVREAMSFNIGARAVRAFCLFEAHADLTTGLLHNASATGVP